MDGHTIFAHIPMHRYQVASVSARVDETKVDQTDLLKRFGLNRQCRWSSVDSRGLVGTKVDAVILVSVGYRYGVAF